MNVRCRISRSHTLCLAAVASVVVLTAAPAEAGKIDRHPGYVDPAPFIELAGDDGHLVEISISGPILKQVSRALTKKSSELSSLLDGIVAINAVIIGSTDGDDALEAMRACSAELDDRGWERLARVRDPGNEVGVYIVYGDDEEHIEGLTVTVFESDGELIFVNLAGRIDLEIIGSLGAHAGIPGLDALEELEWGDEIKERKKKSKKKSKKQRKGKSKKDGRSNGSEEEDD